MHFVTLALLVVAALPPSPAQRVENLLAAPHGVDSRLSPDLVAEVQALCKQPQVYVPLFEAWLDPANFEPDKDELTRFRAQNAMLVLASFCGKDGLAAAKQHLATQRVTRDALWKDLQAVAQSAVKDPKLKPEAKRLLKHHEELLLFERSGLIAFGALKSAELVQELTPRIQTDTQLQLDLVRYFTAAAPGDPVVKSELTTLRKNVKWMLLADAIDAYLKLP